MKDWPLDVVPDPKIIAIMQAKVIDMKTTSSTFNRSPKKHIASRQTKTGVVLLTSDTTTTSMCRTAIILIILEMEDCIDLKSKGQVNDRSYSSNKILFMPIFMAITK